MPWLGWCAAGLGELDYRREEGRHGDHPTKHPLDQVGLGRRGPSLGLLTVRLNPGLDLGDLGLGFVPQRLNPRLDARNALATEIVSASGIRAHELLTLGRPAEQPPDDRRTGAASRGSPAPPPKA